MAAPNPKEGLQAKAKVEIGQALALLKKNLMPDIFLVDGPEWKQLYGAIKSLSKLAGAEESKEVSAAGLKSIAAGLSPKGMAGMGPPPIGGGGPPPQGMPMAGPAPSPIAGLLGGGGG
jgi:hypothetical protein